MELVRYASRQRMVSDEHCSCTGGCCYIMKCVELCIGPCATTRWPSCDWCSFIPLLMGTAPGLPHSAIIGPCNDRVLGSELTRHLCTVLRKGSAQLAPRAEIWS